MLVIAATLISGFACVAVALEAPFSAFGLGTLAYWLFTHGVH